MLTQTLERSLKSFLFISFLLINSGLSQIYAQTWAQRGLDIDAEGADDRAGYAVDLSDDGNTLVVGAYWNDGFGVDAGHARIYEWDGASWIQKGLDIDGEYYEDRFGTSVDLNADGNIVAIGGVENDGNGQNSGYVQVYEWDGTSWIQKGVDIDGEFAFDFSGQAVGLSANGNILAIGAAANDGGGFNVGHVRIFEWDGANWVQVGNDIDGEAISDSSGSALVLSADGSVIAIGAHSNDGNGTNSGHVRVYSWNGSNWIQKGTDLDGEGAYDLFGRSVCLSDDGNTIIIGAPFNINGTGESGHARVYEWDGINWIQKGIDIDGEADNDQFGISVSMSADGNIIAVGGRLNDGNGISSGHTRVFEWDGTAWVQIGWDIDGESVIDTSGKSVSLNSDGSIVAIGAPLNDGGWPEGGHTRVFYSCFPAIGVEYVTACNSYEWIDGNIYTEDDSTATYTFLNGAFDGCDSIVTLYLTIDTVNVTTSYISDTILSANTTGAVYQWLNCNSGYSIISGETGQNFIASDNSNYAVEITENGCTDTSMCMTVSTFNIEESDLFNNVEIFPNPNTGSVNVNLGGLIEITIKVYNVSGQMVYHQEVINSPVHQFDLIEASGIYIVEISTQGEIQQFKLVKK